MEKSSKIMVKYWRKDKLIQIRKIVKKHWGKIMLRKIIEK